MLLIYLFSLLPLSVSLSVCVSPLQCDLIDERGHKDVHLRTGVLTKLKWFVNAR